MDTFLVPYCAATSDVFQTLNGDGTVHDGDVTASSDGQTTFTVTTTATGGSHSYTLDEAGDGNGAPVARPTDDSCPDGRVPEDGFDDAAGNTHETAIDCLVWWKVSGGKTADTYDPSGAVTRAQMASFVARLIVNGGGALPEPTRDWFSDDNGNPHEPNINRLAEAGIVGGTGDGAYAPSVAANRAQMATFLVRAAEHVTGVTLVASRDWFDDDDGNDHEPNINKAAEAGFTGGTASGAYDPGGPVSRAQMASFLTRVLDLLVESGHATPPDVSSASEVSIVTVVADPAGDDVAHDAGEYVEVRNDGDDDVSMNGWWVLDDAEHRLDWCPLRLAPGATARLYTGTGDDGPDHCHAGRSSAVWNNDGDRARLYAPDGATVDAWTY